MSIPSALPSPREVRVAIVGSGLTGLVATYLLTAPTTDFADHVKITVEIFERAATLGMDSASISVPLPIAPTSAIPASSHTTSTNDNDTVRPRSPKRLKLQTQPSVNDADPKQAQSSMRIDVPMRAFTGGYYPQLLALYRHLGIRIKETNFTYSFASLPTSAASPLSALVSPSDTATSSPSSEGWQSPLKPAPIDSSLDIKPPHTVSAPSPDILYNGANGFRGVSLPAALRRPHLSNPVRVSDVLNQIDAIRAYFGSLVMLVLGYLQLLAIALWHHHLGHTCDPTHPLRTYTLIDLVREPFPARSPASKGSPTGMYTRLGLLMVWMVEYALRKLISLDERFAQQTLTPLFSAVMTSSLDSVWASPASEVLDYIALTLGKDHFVVKDGVRTVVASLLKHIEDPNSEAPPSSSSSSSSRSKVWTNAEVRHVHSKDGKAWIDVVHHRRESSPQRETHDMSRAPSSTSTDRTFCNDQDELQQHGPFDHVIFATQANQTTHFLEQYVDSLAATAEEEQERLGQVIDVLTQFKYERSVVVNHTDRGLLPRDRADWRDLNLVSPTQRAGGKGWEEKRRGSESDWTDVAEGSASNDTLFSIPTKGVPGKSAYTMATHVLTLSPSALLVMQTTNPHSSLAPRPGTVLSHSTFERAVIDVAAHVARERLFSISASPAACGGAKVTTAGGRCLSLGELQQQRNGGRAGVWVCGSWAVGIPLLEGCVVSARLVAEEILRREARGEVGVPARW